MKRIVTVKMEVDCTDYFDVEDSDEGAADLIVAAFRREADFPEFVYITCGDAIKHIEVL